MKRQLEVKENAIGAFLDTEEAFDSTSTDTIKQAMIFLKHLWTGQRTC
jgi:hypothetical protein